MRGSTIRLVGVALVGAALVPATAESAVTVIGNSFARSCYEHAESGRNIETGLADCDRALTDQPMTVRDRAATFVNRGILKMRNRNLASAISDYDAALRMKPNLAEAHVNKGIAFVYIGGRDADAVNAISRGIELNTSQPEVAYYTRGVAHELMGNNRAAYNDYRQAATLKPDWAEPQAQLKRFAVVNKPG